MTNAFEYGDALLPQPVADETSDGDSTPSNTPYLNLATFRMVVVNITTADNKKIFNKFTDEIGKTIGKH